MSRAEVAAHTAIGAEADPAIRKYLLASARLGLLAVGYYLAARFSVGFRFENTSIGVVWAANAVLLSALLLTPKPRWWLVIAVTALAHVAAMGASVPAWRMAWQISGNSLFAVATVAALRRAAGLPLSFESRREVFGFTAISLLLPTLYAFVSPGFVRAALHFESGYSPATAVLRTVLSNATGMILVTPVVLLWARRGIPRLADLPMRRMVEGGGILLSLVTVGLIAFGSGPELARVPWRLLLIFPPLLWTAVRFGPLGASTSLFFIAALSMLGTARQLGPFVLNADYDLLVSMQLFWIVLCPPIMLIAAVIRERDNVELALHEQRNQLAHVTRVATVGELSGALAHELRQPLTAILANTQAAMRLLDRQPVDIAQVRECLKDIERQDNQAADVIARLSTLLKNGDAQFEPLAVEGVVQNALALGRTVLETCGVEVQTQIAAELPRVRGDAVQLLQVMLNLIVNACESMSDVAPQDRTLMLSVASRSDEVEIVIADSGIGLSADVEHRAFEPFFTTKTKGLGLGLAIGRSIATAHGGKLWGENNERRGASFHFVLPTVDARV